VRALDSAVRPPTQEPMKRRPPRMSKIHLSPVIARRVFHRSRTSTRRVVVQIGAPRRVPGWDWACPIRIAGLPREPPKTRATFGIDALQALLCAVQICRAVLETQIPPLVWLSEPGDLGLPRDIPESLPLSARKRLEAAIDQEMRRFARTAGRRPTNRTGRRSRDRRKTRGQ